MEKMDHDIAIVGAGVIGCACAYRLQQAGLKVLVLDKEAPGHGASYGNAGHIATEQIMPLANPTILKQIPSMLLDPVGPLRIDWRYLPRLLPWMFQLVSNMRSGAQARSQNGLKQLNQTSLDAWKALLNDINATDLMLHQGSLLVFEHEQTGQELKQFAKKLEQNDVAVTFLSKEVVHRRIPGLKSSVLGALEFPETSHVIDPLKVVESLVNSAKELGAKFKQAYVKGGCVTEGGVELHTSIGTVTFPKVLVAAGAHSRSLVYQLTDTDIPLDTERGYHLMLPNETNRIPVAVTSAERRFIMTPMAGGLRLAGTVEFAGLERPANMDRAHRLAKLGDSLFEHPLDLAGSTPWMGFRPSLPDSLPIIDVVGSNQQVMLALGHHHLGLTQAAVTAQSIVELAMNKSSSLDLSPYRLSRFFGG
ncbi:NAD(P)/FAD-dependent oxidoreductase [Vibrio natriegens]|nr:FAD-binding oxidoreductase [Vibrio natriegens]MDX6028981.1 FAD-binding oxidoreductase [Vibrio natriegens NBRC 15636 = ATCC 14048 = DSM 759]UUI14308.1 FAD-binding oxidoreductase [Vibrio natriegens]WRS50884.1 FAD-binding oxidoreductase [Vibrio natriegens NBRC 15636 = ATCC 14048 = DSM 759]